VAHLPPVAGHAGAGPTHYNTLMRVSGTGDTQTSNKLLCSKWKLWMYIMRGRS